MILIASAAYVTSEFQVEVGELPPAMLPIGNKRLYEHQIAILKKEFPGEKIFISLPSTYIQDEKSIIFFGSNNVEVIHIPEALTLSNSILYAINYIGLFNENFKVLYGDTFIRNFPKKNNALGVAKSYDLYTWEKEIEKIDSDDQNIWCGYFSFSNVKLLIKSILEGKDNFIEAIKIYDKNSKLERLYINQWYDLGHVNTYFRARSSLTTERSFNSLEISNRIVKKSSLNDNHKIAAELNWFKSVPPKIKKYIPQLIDYSIEDDNTYYCLEYLPYLPLNEIFVHSELPLVFWKKNFQYFSDLIKDLKLNYEQDQLIKVRSDFSSLIIDKTIKRMKNIDFSLNSPIIINDENKGSLLEIYESCIKLINLYETVFGIMHGDLCLSNILYDSRSDALKIIDPRALDFDSRFTLFGDLRYDVAKFTHSILGLYDNIISGDYNLIDCGDNNYIFEIYINIKIKRIQQYYIENFTNLFKMNLKDILPIVVLLFISMIPLHYEDKKRQLAFYLNAARTFSLLKDL